MIEQSNRSASKGILSRGKFRKLGKGSTYEVIRFGSVYELWYNSLHVEVRICHPLVSKEHIYKDRITYGCDEYALLIGLIDMYKRSSDAREREGAYKFLEDYCYSRHYMMSLFLKDAEFRKVCLDYFNAKAVKEVDVNDLEPELTDSEMNALKTSYEVVSSGQMDDRLEKVGKKPVKAKRAKKEVK